MTERHNQILYVDDEPQALKYFSQLFGDQFQIVTADSADAALEIIEANPNQISVLVTDQRMPEKTGVELMEEVRARYPRIVRVLTTAHTHLESAIKAVNEGGAFRYLTKPWNDEEMIGTLLRASEYHSAMVERDRLLSEKLSVLHRLIVMDRVRGLATAAAALNGMLRGASQALFEYIRQSPVKQRVHVQMDEIAGMNMVTLARHEGEQMIKTVEMILDDTVNRSTGDQSNVDVASLVDTYVKQSQPRFAEEDIELVVTSAAEVPSVLVQTDVGMLQRLLEIAVRRLADLQEKPTSIHVQILPTDDGLEIHIKGDFDQLSIDQFASLFSAAIPLRKWPIGLDMDLLSGFMIAHHLGGELMMRPEPPDGPGFVLSLPARVPEGRPNLAPGWLDTVYESLEEWEHSMIAD